MATLETLRLSGWKSIKEAEIAFRPLNVLVGANGAGKSNLVSFFRLLNEMIGGRFQNFIGTRGGSEAFLHFGIKRTLAIVAALEFATDEGRNDYYMRLMPAAVGTLIFAEERIEFRRQGSAQTLPFSRFIGPGGHRESALAEHLDESRRTERFLRGLLSRCRVFHFHDTSESAAPRQPTLIDANRHLYPDAGNIAAMLYLYRQTRLPVYHRIVSTIKQVAPFLADFVLEPRRLNPREIQLDWKTIGSDYLFGPHQLSDGTLRMIALATLLLQPEDDFPELLILDEPELGLHPAAIGILAGLLKQAAVHAQVLVATQSATLLNHFDAEDVIVVDTKDGASTFRRLDPELYREWIAEYGLSDLWERNVIGGGPYA